MDPSNNIGKVKEQICMENMARRNYRKKWGPLANAELYFIYNQTQMNQKLKQQLQEPSSFKYTGEGEGYYISKDMYNSLLAVCRCGRERTEGHLLRCLQKELDPHVQNSKSIKYAVPRTSSGLVGWQQTKPVYQQWEQSMKYFSPILTMPGHRIGASPYNAIFIG